MHDINLLPVDQRGKELDEIKKRQEAKSIVKINMSSPDKKPAQSSASNEAGRETEKKSGSFLGNIKNIFKKSKVKSEEVKLKNIENNLVNPVEQNKPEIPKHLDNISAAKPHKEFHFKEKINHNSLNPIKQDNHKHEIKKHEQGLEDIVSHKPTDEFNKRKHEPTKPEVDLNINLIPSNIRKLNKTKNNLRNYIISLIGSLLMCAIILIGISQIVSSQRSDLEKTENLIKQTTQAIDKLKDNSGEVNEFIKLLKNIKSIINSHIKVSGIFELLENNTLKDGVYYKHLVIDSNSLIINLDSIAENYTTAARQILIFRSLADVEQLEVKSMSLIEGKRPPTEEEKRLGITPEPQKFVNFELVLKVNKNILK